MKKLSKAEIRGRDKVRLIELLKKEKKLGLDIFGRSQLYESEIKEKYFLINKHNFNVNNIKEKELTKK